MNDTLRVTTLGGLTLERNSMPLAGLHSRKVDALIVFLIATRQPQPREVLADLLWDEDTRAAANLRVLLSDLRQHLAPFFVITRTTAQVNPTSDIWLDAAAFEAQLDSIALQTPRTAPLTRQAAKTLENALALYHGDFLKGFYIRASPRFEEWVLLEQERLRRRAVTALQRLANFFLEEREYVRGIETASRLFEIDPLNELTQHQLMELLARSGEQNAALAQYEKYKQLLAVELRAEPTPETTALRDQIRAGAFAEKISISVRSNLPRALTPFVGRAQELAELEMKLRDENIALITLTGMGGVGKTRLALRAAENSAAHFRDGVTFIGLASVTTADLVVPTIAATLGVSEKKGETLDTSVANLLRDQEMLLLADNFEHLLDAAPRLTEWLSACPRLKILVTSREKLRVYGEHVFPLAPFAFPEPSQLLDRADLLANLAQYPSVALFVQRATAAQPTFQLNTHNARAVAEICARLDGLPLAIELAAARVNELTPNALLARLTPRLDVLSGGARDRAPRQQSLRGALDWSYELLFAREKKMLRALAVFAGGGTLNAAAAIAQMDTHNALNLLESLANKSLAQRVVDEGDTPRFTLFEIVREYAREQSARANELADLARQHALYFHAYARAAEDALLGPTQVQWLNDLERELDNVRAALQWTLEQHETEIGLELAHNLGRFWTVHDHWAEGRRWLEQLLALPESSASPLARARGHFSAGLLASFMSDLGAARAHLEMAQHLRKGIDDARLAAQIQLAACSVHQLQGDHKTARRLVAEAGAFFEPRGTPNDKAWCKCARAGLQLQRGRFLAARSDFERALAEFRNMGDHWGCAVALSYLAFVARFTLQRAQASAYKAEALALLQECGDHARIALAHFFLGAPSDEPAERDAELKFFQDKVNVLARQDDAPELARALLGLASATHRHGDDARAKQLFAEGLNASMQVGLRSEAVECLEGLAGVAAAQDEPERAVRLFGAVDALRQVFRGALARAWRGNYGTDLALARAQLDEERFNALWQQGRAMNLADAIQYALAENSEQKL